jgi:ketosteroid isomerase-like protein
VIEYELTVKATGTRVRDEEIHLMEFGSDGKMTAYRHFLDTAKAIEAHS